MKRAVRTICFAILLVALVSPTRAMDDQMPFDDLNAFLGNSPRTDLIGPEMWTAQMHHAARECDDQVFIGGQMPYHCWPSPQIGLIGQLHLVHRTDLNDVIRIEISECDGQKRTVLRMVPTRNLWTPAKLTTYYRSSPNSLGTDFPQSGACGIKETKCITTENVFVTELEIGNNSPQPRTFELKCVVALPELTKSTVGHLCVLSGPVHFTTEAMGEKTPRTSFAVAASTGADFTEKLELGPWQRKTIRYGFTLRAVSAENALDAVEAAIADDTVFVQNVSHFNDWFRRNVPALDVRNFDLLKMYYYRWFLVYRSRHEARRLIPDHEYPRPVMYESPTGGWYGCVIGLPMPMQIQEAAWLRDPGLAWNHVLNWAENVRGYRDYIQFTPVAVWKLFAHHPDREKLASCFDALKEYSLGQVGSSFDRLPIQCGSWNTGAEYQPNFYQFTAPPWDYRNDYELQNSESGLQVAKLIRLDTAGYAIGDLMAVGHMAEVLDQPNVQKQLNDGATALLTIVKEKHWSRELGLFLASDPDTGKLADQAACYDSFVPYMWGMVREPEYFKAFDKLLSREWFWDDFPIATTAKTCPMYFDNNALVGPANATLTEPHSYECCWNGPMWNYANALIAESLGRGALVRPELRDRWLDFFTRWSNVQFQYGDRSVPYTSEHHRSGDGARLGEPSEYFHSAWIDPFISYWCGIRVDDKLKTMTFDPFCSENFSLAHVPLVGKEYTFEQNINPTNHQRELVVYDADRHVLKRQVGSQPLILQFESK